MRFDLREVLPDWLVNASMFHCIALGLKNSLGGHIYGRMVRVRTWMIKKHHVRLLLQNNAVNQKPSI